MTTPEQEKQLAKFETALRRAKLSETAVDHYVGVIRRGLAAGDVLAPLRGAASRGGIKIAKAALLRWYKFTEDPALAARVRAILSPPRGVAQVAKLTWEQRAKITAQVTKVEDKIRRGFLLLVVWSGLRVGEILAASRQDLRAWCSTKFAGNEVAGHGAEMLLGRWRGKPATVQALLATTAADQFRPAAAPTSATYVAAYAVLRRLLRGVCKRAGVAYVQPEEFRRLVLSAGADRTGDRNVDRKTGGAA